MQRANPVSSSVPPSNIPQPTGLSGLISRVSSAISYRWLLWTPLAIGAGKAFGAAAGYFLFGLLVAVEVYLHRADEPNPAAGVSASAAPQPIAIRFDIGSPEKPASPSKFQEELESTSKDYGHGEHSGKPMNLVIYGDKLGINSSPLLFSLKPMKLILVGARITHEPSGVERLDDAMADSKDWESSMIRLAPYGTFTKIYTASSVEEALTMRNPPKLSLKNEFFRMVIVVPSPAK